MLEKLQIAAQVLRVKPENCCQKHSTHGSW